MFALFLLSIIEAGLSRRLTSGRSLGAQALVASSPGPQSSQNGSGVCNGWGKSAAFGPNGGCCVCSWGNCQSRNVSGCKCHESWGTITCDGDVTYTMDDPLISYEGRFKVSGGEKAEADWPCSTVRFNVHRTSDGGTVTVEWFGVMTRVNASVWDTTTGALLHTEEWKGPAVSPRVSGIPIKFNQGLPLFHENCTVTLRKLTCATPLSNGIGRFTPSIFSVYHVVVNGGRLVAPPTPKRLITFIGASDTQGYCVDGTPDTPSSEYTIGGWQYGNCDAGYVGNLGRMLDADISVQALAGMGVTQNQNAAEKWQSGELTMADLYPRRMQTESVAFKGPLRAQLVVVSLGGNDYNHQNGHVPSNATFAARYIKMLDGIFASPFGRGNNTPTVVNICGQGSPDEAKRDPDNNRCRPCPHVQAVVEQYARENPDMPIEYILVPCDGSVVTGEGDIGCNGHKNKLGQMEVAKFLAPKLRVAMGW